MLRQILLLNICSICIEGMVLSGAEFSTKLCATREISVSLFGSTVKTVECREPGFGAATHSLSGSPHWCLQDYMEVTKDPDNTFLIPSGCSLWVKEADNIPLGEVDDVDRTGMKKLSQVRLRYQHVPGWSIGTKECGTRGEGLNSGSHNLRATDYWCRQQTISLPFAGDDPFPSGCSCYVR